MEFMFRDGVETGTITINGEPRAVNLAKITLSGARPQIDGTYQIETVVHSYSRRGGYITEVHIMRDNSPSG